MEDKQSRQTNALFLPGYHLFLKHIFSLIECLFQLLSPLYSFDPCSIFSWFCVMLMSHQSWVMSRE